MSDFNDRPFVAGSLVGLRAFDIDKMGRLVGPSFGGVFKPGENEAACHSAARAAETVVTMGGRVEVTASGPWAGVAYHVETPDGHKTIYGSSKAFASEYPASDGHRPGEGNCSCGYYAYFDGQNDYGSPGRLTTVIEGYGVCTVGKRGFRAEKARLLAIVEPYRPDAPKTSRWARLSPWWSAFLLTINAAIAVWGLIEGNWWRAGINGGVVVILAVLDVFSWRARRRSAKARTKYASLLSKVEVSEAKWGLVRRNYPDVPVYKTLKEALAAHPLTPPPPPPVPTPDDEDFWTREVPA